MTSYIDIKAECTCFNQARLSHSLVLCHCTSSNGFVFINIKHLYLLIFSFVWLGLTNVSQAAAGRNPWIDTSKCPKYNIQSRYKVSSLHNSFISVDFGLLNEFRECVRAGAAGSQTLRFLGHHLLHPLILRLLVKVS